ncbi:MAG: hypothetical protein ACKVHE_29770 [Planctomycetales bacterium]|jgi:hypothetical protein
MMTFRTKTALLSFAFAAAIGLATLPTSFALADDSEATSKAKPAATAETGGEVTTEQTPDLEIKPKPQSILLRYHFKRGQYVHYEEDSRSEIILMARAQTQSTRESRRTNKHFRVVSVDENGSAVIEPVIDRVQMEVRNDGAPPVTYDSASKGPTSKDFKKVDETIGKPSLRIRYSASGKVEQLLPLQAQSHRKVDAEEQEKQNFLIVFPEETIAVGEAWTDNYMIDVSVDGKLRNPLKKRVKVRRTYKLKEVKNNIASISFRIFPLAVERDPRIKGELIHHSRFGTIEFDVERGIILEWQSSGSGHVFDAFGPASSMKALSSTTERYVPSPSAAKRQAPVPKKPAGPAGPQLPGIAARQQVPRIATKQP